jgi:hypothetical protein
LLRELRSEFDRTVFVLKYLVIAALVALLLLLVYSKLYPYLQILKKILGAARTMADTPLDRSEQTREAAAKGGRKLVKCVGCGTWVPAERAIASGRGQLVYCSRECIESASNGNERKMAG